LAPPGQAMATLDRSLDFDINEISQLDGGNDLDTFDGPAPGDNFLNNQDMNNELLDTQTAVSYIITSLKQSLSMRHNQVGGLLANQNKYLIVMCVKGMKNNDFSKILNWYKLILNNIGHLIYLLQNEIDQVSPSMSVLKCGLFSKDADVANLCCRVFTKMVSIFNENS